jgi:hypothetical protein
LIEVVAVAFRLHVVAMDEAERGRVDAVAQTPPVARTVGEDMTQMAVAMGERTSVRIMPRLRSRNSMTWAGSIGLVKLGQPQPLSYLSEDAKSGSPETTST